MDCWMFVVNHFKQRGISISHKNTSEVSLDDAKKDDIILFDTINQSMQHAGLYLGGGMVKHFSDGVKEQRLDDLNMMVSGVYRCTR